VGTYRAFWEHRSVRYRGARLIFSIQAYPDNNIVRTWRRTPIKDFEDVARDKCELREVLGDNAETIDRLPTRRIEDPAHPESENMRQCDQHKPHCTGR
jgi:hypothetical protein